MAVSPKSQKYRKMSDPSECENIVYYNQARLDSELSKICSEHTAQIIEMIAAMTPKIIPYVMYQAANNAISLMPCSTGLKYERPG